MSESNRNLPTGFRDSTGEALPHPDLGPLPEEWRVLRLGEVISPSRYKVRAKDYHGEFPIAEKIPFDSGEVVFRKKRETKTDLFVGEAGTLLVSNINFHQGAVAIVPYIMAATTHFDFYKTTEDLTYLWYYFRTPIFQSLFAEEIRRWGFKKEARYGFIAHLQLPLPPLPEQRAIAHVLTSIQRAIEATERVIAAARELKKSLMRHLFTYGPVPVGAQHAVPLRETEIGPIPAHWQVVRLGEVAVKTKQVDPRKNPSSVFKYIDVSSISREQLAITNYAEYVGAQAPHRARKAVKEGDIIFATVRPYLKRVALVDHQFDGEIVSTAFCVIRCNFDKVLSNYIFQVVIQDDFVERVAQHQRGSSYPAVMDKDVLRQTIPLPPLPEQRAIAEMLRTVDEKIQAEENRKTALQSLFHTMLHHLMTGKVRLPREFIAGFKESA